MLLGGNIEVLRKAFAEALAEAGTKALPHAMLNTLCHGSLLMTDGENLVQGLEFENIRCALQTFIQETIVKQCPIPVHVHLEVSREESLVRALFEPVVQQMWQSCFYQKLSLKTHHSRDIYRCRASTSLLRFFRSLVPLRL